MEGKRGYSKKVTLQSINGTYWKGQPAGLFQRFLTKIHCNFTYYQITEDELIIIRGFFKKRYDTHELFVLKDVDMTQNLIQQWLKIGDISAIVDAASNSVSSGETIVMKNVKNPEEIRKLLRDAIEDDVMERGIRYFNKI